MYALQFRGLTAWRGHGASQLRAHRMLTQSREPAHSMSRSQPIAQAFVPPSTVRFAPVMYDDSGPATNDTSAATSSTDP
jgi:hypothetical protein